MREKNVLSNVDQNKRFFIWDEGSEAALENAFGTSEDKQKKWIEKYVPGTFLDSKKQQIMYSDFVTKKLKLYFTTSNQRKQININKKNYILKKNDKKSKKIILKKYEKKVIQYIIIVLLI
ncbi:putative DNA topoisomerase (ATP-hydrolyzing) [Arabidopsis thaliana]